MACSRPSCGKTSASGTRVWHGTKRHRQLRRSEASSTGWRAPMVWGIFHSCHRARLVSWARRAQRLSASQNILGGAQACWCRCCLRDSKSRRYGRYGRTHAQAASACVQSAPIRPSIGVTPPHTCASTSRANAHSDARAMIQPAHGGHRPGLRVSPGS